VAHKDDEAVLCSSYESFEEDFGITEQADDLRSALPEAGEEKKLVRARRPGEIGQVMEMEDGYYVEVDGEADFEERKQQALYWVEKKLEDGSEPRPQLWREAGRQKVLLGLRKPPVQVLQRRPEPEADCDAAWKREKTRFGE